MSIDIKNLPKYLLWFTFILIIVSFATLFIPSKFFCKAPEWLGIFEAETFSLIAAWILSVVIFIAILLLILSIFSGFKMRGLLMIAIILAAGGIIFFLGVGSDYRCPDKDRKAMLVEFRAGEVMFFKEYQRYASYEEISGSSRYKDPETGKPYILILTDDKQNFEIIAKLDQGGWFICDRDGCEEKEEINDEIPVDEVFLPSPERIYENSETGAVYVEDELMIRFKEDVSKTRIKEIISSVGGKIVGYISDIEIYQILVPVTDPSELESLIQQLESYPEVIIATYHWLDEAF